MNAIQLKTALLAFFRFKRQWTYINTEAGHFYADVLATNGKKLVEVEVKVTYNDISADFQKPKHDEYRSFTEKGANPVNKRTQWIPNEFYFAVPERLLDALEYQLKEWPEYGIIVVNQNSWGMAEARIVRKAKLIHPNKPTNDLLNSMIKRMGSDLITLYQKRELEGVMVNKMIKANRELIDSVSNKRILIRR